MLRIGTDFSHIFEMFDDTNMRSGLNPFYHIAQCCHACCVVVQLLASYQKSLSLLGLWITVFLGDKNNGNAAPCTLDALLAVIPSTLADITVSATEGL